MIIEKAMFYCRNALQNVSRSFALTIPLVEKNILVPILVGYLEARILDSFEDEKSDVNLDKRIENIKKVIKVIERPDSLKSELMIKEIGDEAATIISNPHYLDLAQNMDKVIAVHKTMDSHAQSSISLWFGRMADGMEKYLNKRIDTFPQLDEYCYYVGGTVGGMLTDLVVENTEKATQSQVKILRMGQNDFGLFLQKVNIIRDFREDILRNEKIFWPYNIFKNEGLKPPDVLRKENEKKALVILEKMISSARGNVNASRDYINAVPEDYPGYKRFTAINFLMGTATIDRIEGNTDIFYNETPVKIDKSVRNEIIRDPIGMLKTS
jgi:farnesyl-diphosphate farnesyltransferase